MRGYIELHPDARDWSNSVSTILCSPDEHLRRNLAGYLLRDEECGAIQRQGDGAYKDCGSKVKSMSKDSSQ
jgi:hypothetical protein